MSENIFEGIIIREKRGLFCCESEGGQYDCRAATRLRRLETAPVAGDRVRFSVNSDGSGFITEVLERKSYFLRPHIANADVFVIVITPADPQPDLFVIDKLSCVAVRGGAEPVFVVNKNDKQGGAELAAVYEKCGFTVFRTTAQTGEGVEQLGGYIAGRTAVLCGASGVGKSTLLNILCPEAGAQTGGLSEKISRGRNTTRHTELYHLSGGGYIADTPGFSLLDISEALDVDVEELAGLFPEFEKYRYACRYRGCTHTKDEGCAVTAAVANGDIPAGRQQSYIDLYAELRAMKDYSRRAK